ncbi:hypothetical protein HY972_01380 [Candidatus Kaiserbacteria bacterium]|nr:hypothetical protein [Candidatus Kaiserbacteria bacterium]
MRAFIVAAFVLVLSLGTPLFALADFAGTANGSSCDLNGQGPGTGRIWNGNCISPSSYQSQSGGTGGYQSGGSGTGAPATTLINPLNAGTSLESFLGNILDFIIRIGAIVVILMLVYVGYLFVVARGNDSKITEARQALLWTVVGALILLGAKAIAVGIEATVRALSTG